MRGEPPRNTGTDGDNVAQCETKHFEKCLVCMVRHARSRQVAYHMHDDSEIEVLEGPAPPRDPPVQSVAAKTMTEPEAQRKWIEFKLARSDERRREIMAAAAAGPVVCNRTGNTSICY